MRASRRWFAWAFLLATIVAQGPHDHRGPAGPGFEPAGDCDQAGPHWAGHPEVSAEGGPDTCPLCQLRCQPALTVERAACPRPTTSTAAVPTFEVRTPAPLPLRLRCRAPPIA